MTDLAVVLKDGRDVLGERDGRLTGGRLSRVDGHGSRREDQRDRGRKSEPHVHSLLISPNKALGSTSIRRAIS